MKTILQTAVLFAAIVFGITACTDVAKEKLIAEMDTFKLEFQSLDSSLSAIKTFLNQKTDSLAEVINIEPKRKNEIDSVLENSRNTLQRMDSVASKHLLQTAALDSLRIGVEQGNKSAEKVIENWNLIKDSHNKAMVYAKELNTSVLFVLITDIGRASLAKEPSIKKKK